MQVYELHIIRKLKMGTKKDKTLKTLSGISKPKYNISESHIREYFKITKNIYGGRYKEIVEEFIKNKNIMDEISKEDFKLFNRLLQYHDIFRQIPTQKMEKN